MSPPIALPTGVRRAWPRLRLAAGALVLGFLIWRFGTGPFADAGRVATWSSVAASLAVNAACTLVSAWRWRVVSRVLGAPLTVWESVTAYYRSQFLNAALPGGVLGDAHRGVRHGRAVGDVGTGLRATVWDRTTGQIVQVALLVLALVLLPTPLRPLSAVVAAAVLLLAGLAGWVGRRYRAASWMLRDLRALLRPPVLTRVALASVGTTAGHVAVFLLAAHAVGVRAPVTLLVPCALVVLVGSAVPLNVAGWGPREGFTIWVFAFAGLGPAMGLSVSIGYGVLGAVATAPGVLVLLADAAGRRRDRRVLAEQPVARPLETAARG